MSFYLTNNAMPKNLNHAELQTRRDFLRHAAQAYLGVAALPLIAGQDLSDFGAIPVPTGTAKSVIYIYLNGGMSHIDTFDTKPGKDVQGPVESIKTSADSLRVSEFFPKLSKHMHHVAIINSMNSTQGAHAQGQYYMHTSYFVRGTIQHPHMGSWASYFLGKQNRLLPANVKIGSGSDSLGAGFLEASHAAVPIRDPAIGLQNSKLPDGVSQYQFTKRMARLRRMNRSFQSKYDTKQTRAYSGMYDEAVRLMKSRDLAAFDITKENEKTRQRYGNHRFGQASLLAKRLIKNKIQFVEIYHGGWDTHDNNFERVQNAASTLDDGLSALLSDLEVEGLLDQTLIVVATEFGRTPTIQTEKMGRNHYPQAFTCLLAGGGIKGGIKYGKTDEEGREVVENLVSVPDFNATIAHAIGLPIEKEVVSPSGRPFTVADKGSPILELFS